MNSSCSFLSYDLFYNTVEHAVGWCDFRVLHLIPQTANWRLIDITSLKLNIAADVFEVLFWCLDESIKLPQVSLGFSGLNVNAYNIFLTVSQVKKKFKVYVICLLAPPPLYLFQGQLMSYKHTWRCAWDYQSQQESPTNDRNMWLSELYLGSLF